MAIGDDALVGGDGVLTMTNRYYYITLFVVHPYLWSIRPQCSQVPKVALSCKMRVIVRSSDSLPGITNESQSHPDDTYKE